MDVKTDVLIVGTGPAGASLASFLIYHGVKGLMVGNNPGSITTPRAHITNMAALECLRDIGLEEEVLAVASPNKYMEHYRWAYSMAGEEFGRGYSWGHDPRLKPDYSTASPCTPVDCPQSLLEPILVRYASRNGFTCRFDTTWLSFERQPDGSIVSNIEDNITKARYKVHSKFLFGCDGGRSAVVKQLELPLIAAPAGGTAWNVLIRADLSQYMAHRNGNIHWLLQPDTERPAFAFATIIRMVKPWHEWLVSFLPDPVKGGGEAPDHDSSVKMIKQAIGNNDIPIKVIDIMRWNINDVVAEKYSEGNIFCLGDAVHRHPPTNGLGSNTCVQDAFNIAWKVAYVLSGKAGRALLETYSKERQPVGAGVVARANASLKDHGAIWAAIGMLEPDLEARTKALATLQAATPEGAAKRADLQKAVLHMVHEINAVGIEMNQRYESTAIYVEDERPWPPHLENPVLQLEISTRPGARLPHAWLNTPKPQKQISTRDLAGHGKFCLLTGIGGSAWASWARAVSAKLNVDIACYTIGFRQDYEDVYFDWAQRREVDESGCVLARPDRTVAWRCHNVAQGSTEKLLSVMQSILSR